MALLSNDIIDSRLIELTQESNEILQLMTDARTRHEYFTIRNLRKQHTQLYKIMIHLNFLKRFINAENHRDKFYVIPTILNDRYTNDLINFYYDTCDSLDLNR